MMLRILTQRLFNFLELWSWRSKLRPFPQRALLVGHQPQAPTSRA
jgi:hypothetical protein